VAARQACSEAADAPERLAEAAARRDRFEKHATIHQLERNVDKVVIVGEPDRIGPSDPGRAAELGKEIAQVMQGLGMDEPANDPDDDPLRWAATIVRLIPEHFPGHPAVEWYVGITNALGEHDLPYHGVLHRFRRGRHTAYLWLEEDQVLLSPWHVECRPGRTVRPAESVATAIDLLARLPLPRPWWRFWS